MISIGRWRYRRFHISYLLGWLALGVLIGLLCAKAQAFTVHPIGAIIFALLCLPALRSRRWWTVAIVGCVGVVLGLARGTDYASQFAVYDRLVGKEVVVSGTVVTDPQRTKSGVMAFELGGISFQKQAVAGELYVSIEEEGLVKRGDTVQVKGRMKEAFATYRGSLTYAKVLKVSRYADPIRDIRERFVDSVRQFVAEPMASLGVGFVVGQRSSLSPELDEQLKIVGLTHIVVASGYNLTILVRFARRLLARHSRYLALVASLILMLSFVAFSGLSPSMNRAVAVTGLSLLAWYYGRRFHPLLLIAFVAAATAYWNPVYIWDDLGWYLSFFAFAGVLILAPLVAAVVYRDRKPPAIVQLVIETLSAELMTLPLIALAFGVFPSFGLLANVLVGPLIPFAMLATTIAGLCGIVLPILAPVSAIPAAVIIGYVVMVVETLSAIEWALLEASVTLPAIALWFTTLVECGILAWRRTNYDFRSSSITD